MAEKQTYTMTGLEAQRAFNALAALGEKTMASITADLKVARLKGLMKNAAEPITATKRKAALLVMETAGVKPTQDLTLMPMLSLQVQEAQHEAELAPVEVTVPDGWRLVVADLPKRRAPTEERPLTEHEQQNIGAIGALVGDLGPLFTYPADDAEM